MQERFLKKTGIKGKVSHCFIGGQTKIVVDKCDLTIQQIFSIADCIYTDDELEIINKAIEIGLITLNIFIINYNNNVVINFNYKDIPKGTELFSKVLSNYRQHISITNNKINKDVFNVIIKPVGLSTFIKIYLDKVCYEIMSDIKLETTIENT